jgi:ATP-binding cassette subfamily F protein 3
MLVLRHARLRRGARVLVEDASLAVHRGEKVGVVGRNGSGKSSLLALVRGELALDAGEYDAPAGLRMAWVAQELPSSTQPLVDYVLDGDLELRAVERAIESARDAHDGAREAALHAELEALGGYSVRARAAQMLSGLGFAPEDLERPIEAFSGGLRMRANLARALMRRADLLLLDEPTNHLDLDAVLWLEAWLCAFAGTLLLVSHDREFLDAIVGRVLHIEAGKLRAYEGNYSAFERQRAAERERLQALATRREAEIEHVRRFVDRFRAKASKARQVQSRLKWLARLERVAAARDEESFEWQFAQPVKLPRPLVSLETVAAGYGERTVLKQVSLAIEPADRIGILGRNGAGKSTLMRIVAGMLTPRAGARVAAPDLKTGFFAQLEIEQLDASGSALAELARRGGTAVAAWSEQQRRDHLGRFGFRGDRVFEPIERFSGGERARLMLAILVARRPNLLLLDEPTNHLDFDMRDALILALQEFAGAVVIVSHDRALLSAVCDRFLLVREGEVAPFDGDLEDYAAWLTRNARAGGAADGGVAERSAASRREEKRRAAQARNRLSPLRVRLREIETRLASTGEARAALEQELAQADFHATQSRETQHARMREHERLSRQLAELEEQWLALSEELERVTANG